MAVLFHLLGSGSDLRAEMRHEPHSLIRGGTVLDQTRRAPRRRRDRGRRGRRGRRRLCDGDDTARRRAAASSRPASSTCTSTSASPAGRKPRRSRPAAAPPRSAGSPPSWRCPTPIRRRTRVAVVDFVRAPGRGGPGCATCSRRVHHRSVATATRWRRSASSPPPACACSPTTATACRTRS